jgi:breast cancer 2 susceptibility protein
LAQTDTGGDASTRPILPSIYPSFQRASAPLPGPQGPGLGFTSASVLSLDDLLSSQSQPQSQSESRPRSPEIPPEIDYSAWFAPIPKSALPPTANLFTPASALPLTLPQDEGLFGPASDLPNATDGTTVTNSEEAQVQQAPMILGRLATSHERFLEPSAAALELAEKKLRAWQAGDPDLMHLRPSALKVVGGAQKTDVSPPKSPVLGAACENELDSLGQMRTPDTPTPAGSSGFGRASMVATTCKETAGNLPTFSALSMGFSEPSAGGVGLGGDIKHKFKPKPFKSPLLKNSTSNATSMSGYTSSPLNPNRPQLSGSGFAPASAAHPLAGPPLTLNDTTTPVRSALSRSVAAGFVTPMRSLLSVGPRNVHASASVVRSTPAKFVTPFKDGMRPGEKGRVALDSVREVGIPIVRPPQTSGATIASTLQSGKGKERWKAFDLGTFSPACFRRVLTR